MRVSKTSTGGREETPQRPADQLGRLLDRARNGEEDAFRTLYRRLTPELLRYAAVIVGQDAEDVVADAWLQVSRDLHRFDGDGAAFRRFTVAVTRNRARDLLRRRKRRAKEVALPLAEMPEPRLPYGDGSRDTAEVAGSRLTEREVVAHIGRLPQAQAEAVLLRIVLDMDTRSAAKVLGRRPGAVATALSRGLRQLARLAQEDDMDEGTTRGQDEEVGTRCGTGTSTKRNCDG